MRYTSTLITLHYIMSHFVSTIYTIVSDTNQSVTDRLLSEANQAIRLLDYQSLDPSFPFAVHSSADRIFAALVAAAADNRDDGVKGREGIISHHLCCQLLQEQRKYDRSKNELQI